MTKKTTKSRTVKGPALAPGSAVTSMSTHPLVSGQHAPSGKAPPRDRSQRNNQRGSLEPANRTQDFSKPDQGSLYNELAHNYVRDAISTLDTSGNWFSPFQPVAPFGPPGTDYPRTYDYTTGVNLNINPGRLTFYQSLRALSRSWGILRTVIETRKDQFMRMPHAFQVKGAPRKKNKRIDELNQFFLRPDGKNTFSRWKRLLLEDMLTIDAATVFKWKSMLGTPLAYDVLDGTTIKCLIDDAGRRPTAPDPAYQQIIKGLPMTNWSEDDIRYMPMRPVPDAPMYGYSPVEQILAEITAGIKRLAYQVSFWTEGSMPELIITAPDAWTPTQLAQYQGMFDAMMSGNTPYKSKVRFVPGGMKPFDIKNANGEALKADIDEWWARLICYAFGVSPQPFIKMMNRSTAQTAQAQAEEEGLHPVMLWFKEELMDPIVQEDFGYDDIEFNFLPNPEVDQTKQMTILTGYVKEGIMERNEARMELGLDNLPGGDELVVDTPNGPVPLVEAVEAARVQLQDAPNEVARKQEAHDTDMKATKATARGPKAPAAAGASGAPRSNAGKRPPATTANRAGVGKAAEGTFLGRSGHLDEASQISGGRRDWYV